MYPYHNRIKQRISAGELVDYYFTDRYPRIGSALVLVFSTTPHLRPIRPHKWAEYAHILKEENAVLRTLNAHCGEKGGDAN